MQTLFFKEKEKDKPYFILKVDNIDMLIKSSEEENMTDLNIKYDLFDIDEFK